MSSQMETLSNNFNALLIQYQETYQEFVNTINSGNNLFMSVPYTAFVGKSNINTIQGSSVKTCLSSCSSNQSCSGATFDNNLHTCTLSSGIGNLINSNNQTAIVKQALYYSHQLQKLNDQLTQINNQIINLANSSINFYSQTQQQNNKKAQILNQNYKTLEEERLQLIEMIRQYETLNSDIENGNINTTSNYYTYLIYIFIFIFLLIILFSFGFTNQQRGGSLGKNQYLLYLFLAVIIIFNAV
jgi:hypothetical protein